MKSLRATSSLRFPEKTTLSGLRPSEYLPSSRNVVTSTPVSYTHLSFVVKELKVVEGPSGLFVSMPSRKVGDGGYRDIVHPITVEARDEIQTMVLAEFEKQTGDSEVVVH